MRSNVRFRKAFKLGKLLSLNIGKKGPSSLSLRLLPGVTMNFGRYGPMLTLGLPGTGLGVQLKPGGKKK